MKKMNFYNQLKEEDRSLIQLLKEETLESPSDQFEENTMIEFMALRDKQEFVFKPLRFPLFIMAAMVLMIALPFFVPFVSPNSFPNPLSGLMSYPASSIVEFIVWSWLAAVTWLISTLLFPKHLKFNLYS